jgi:hypothetical protein
VEARDHSTLAERPYPFQAGRLGDPEALGEVAVGLPAVLLERLDDRRIKFVHDVASRTISRIIFGN